MTARRALGTMERLPRRRHGAYRAVRDRAPVQGQRAGDQPARAVSVLAILAALRMQRRQGRDVWRAPWVLFAIGMALFWCGDLYTYSYPLLLNRDVPFPSLGDAAYILVYPALMAGLLMLAHRRSAGRDLGGAVDAAILTLGLALPSWVALIAPYLHDDSLTPLARIVSVAYPMGDVLLLAAAVRLALDAGRRSASFYLLESAIVLLLITDFVYGLMIFNGSYDHQLWLDVGWIGFYLLWGAAALHPTMPGLAEPEQGRARILTRFRLVLLTGASLIAPVIALVHAVRNGDVTTRSSRSRRSRCSRWSWSVWPVWFASRSAPWNASAC